MKTRKLLVRKPIAIEAFKLERVWSKEGGIVEPFEGIYALRQGDVVEVTSSRANQLLATSPETFALKGKEELWEFLDACCEEDEGEVELSRLWEEYRSWAEDRREPPMSKEVLEKELSGLFEVVESEKGPSLRGLRLREEGEANSPT